MGRISPDEGKHLKILNIETRYYCNLIYLNYSTLYNIVFGVIVMLYYMHLKATTNCISSNDHLCIL